MALNMASFGFFVCMMVPCILMLWLKRETLEKRGWLLFGITGAATYYFNMNYIQLLCFGVPVLFYFLLTGVPEKPLRLLGRLAELFIAWMAGLVGMMVFKWVAYAILKDPKVFSEMLDQFFFSFPENDMDVIIDGEKYPMLGNMILHIPLGSEHGVEVTGSKHMHYMWIDFLPDNEAGLKRLESSHKPTGTMRDLEKEDKFRSHI